ncbi:MAG: beta-propeller domain-containing protein, partial [Granulosicoccaceae bacterium]
SSLKRFSLSGPAVLEQEASLPKGVTWDGLYYVESTQQLVLQGEGLTGVYPADLSSYWWNGGEVLLRGVDATGNLDSSTWELSVDGQLLGSRRLGDTLYIVTEYGAPYIHPYAEQSGNIDELTLAEWLPSWRFNGVEQGALVSASDCFRPAVDERRESTRVTALIALPLNNPAQLETRCLLGTSETLYVSQEALYIATTQTYYEGWNSPSFDLIFPTATTTDVHKFSFDDSLSYRGGVSLSGHLGWRAQQRSYRMGEVDGVLSVVTSGGSLWGSMDQNHRLYTLQEQPSGLALVAQLPNENRTGAIGKPGERIYGTRAVGDRVYVVTFLNTDPLYVIDVSDAADPFVAGELEVPGFSDYLHPLGDGLLVGIGKSASAAQEGDESRGGWYQGLRLSLFDVSEPSNPSLINALEYGDRGTDTDLFSDFHALAWRNTSSESAEFALPVSLYRYNSAPEYPWELGDFVHRGLYRFSVDGTGLKEASQSLVDGGAYSYHRDGRAVLANDGDAWFYDDGELYYIHSSSPSVLQASE